MAAVPYLAGTYTAAAGGVNALAGATILVDSNGQQADMTTWSNLVYPVAIMKVFFQQQDPSNPSVSLVAGDSNCPTTPNSTLNACIALGTAALLMYVPAWAANSNGTGNATAAQLNADLANIHASLTGLQNSGVTVAGVGMCNEPENGKAQDPNTPQQYLTLFQYDYTSAGTGAGQSFTANHASPCVFTCANHNYAEGQPVKLSGGSLPGGFSAGTVYYVDNTTSNTFNLSSTNPLLTTASDINSSSTGGGTVTYQGFHDLGWSLCAVHDAAFNGADIASYFTGPPTLPAKCSDYQIVDYYGGININQQQYLWGPGQWFTLAQAAGMGVGIGEQGNSASQNNFPQTQITPFISATGSAGFPGDPVHSTQASLMQAKAQGVPVLGYSWWQNDAKKSDPNYIGASATDFRIPLLQGLATSLSGLSATCGITTAVNAGDSVYVGCLATAGSVTGVTDTRGNTYSLALSETAQSGAKLFVFSCPGSGQGSIAFTATKGSAAAFTVSSGVFALGDPVKLSGSSLPGGFTAGTTYYVDNPATASQNLYTFNLSSTNPLTATPRDITSTSSGSGNVTSSLSLTTNDIVTAAYSSGSSVQAVTVVGNTGVSGGTDRKVGASGNSTAMTVATGQLSGTPEHVVVFYASQAAGGQPTIGAQLTALGQVQAPSSDWLTSAYKVVNSTATTNITGTLPTTAAEWSEIVVTGLAGAPSPAFADVIGFTDSLLINGTLTDVIGFTDSLSVQGSLDDVIGFTDELVAANTGILVQQVPGSSVFDYGWSTTDISTAAGSTLVVLAGWDLSTGPTNAPMPAVYVNDSQGNFWYHVATTTAGVTGSRCSAWICPNAAAVTWVSVSLTTFCSSLAYTIVELSGMPLYYSLDVLDAAAVASSQSLSLLPGITSDADFAFGIVAAGSQPSPPAGTTDWVSLDPVGSSSSSASYTNAVRIFPYYTSSASGRNLNTTFTFNLALALSGIIFAVHSTVAPPFQNNPSLPVNKVEIGFGSTPGDPSQAPPVWTEITARVIAPEGGDFINAAMGHAYELATTEAGEMTIMCDNADGALTPGNVNSVYYPDVVLETPVRVSAFWNGTWYPIAYGYVERWPQEWPDLPQWGISKMVATDAISILAANNMASALESDMLLDAPFLLLNAAEQYLSFSNGINSPSSLTNEGGTIGSFVAADAQGLPALNTSRTNQTPGYYVDGNSAGTGAGPAIAATGQTTNLLGTSATGFGTDAISTPPTSPSCGPGIIYTDPNMPDPATGVTVALWVIIGSTATSPSLRPTVFTAYGPPSSYQMTPSLTVQILNDGSNLMQITLADSSTVTAPFEPQASPQMIVLAITATTLSVFVNGGQVLTTALTIPQTTSWNAVSWGCPNYAYQAAGLVSGNFTAFDLASYGYVLPLQRVVAQFATGIGGQQSVDATTRIAQILSWANLGIPRSGQVSFNGTPADVLEGPAYNLSGATAADAVNQVVTNETGLAAAMPTGALQYFHQWALFNQQPAAQFGDAPNPALGQVPYLQVTKWDYDNTYLDNQAAVTQQYGANNLFTATSLNTTSAAEYFTRSPLTLTISTMSNLDPVDTANWLTAKYSQPSLRISGMSVDASSNPAVAFPVALGLQQGDVVTVTRSPVGGATITQNCIIEKAEHKVGPSAWTTSYQMSPYDIEGAILQLDAPLNNTVGDGVLG